MTRCCIALDSVLAQSHGRAKGIHQQMFIEEPSQKLRWLTVIGLSKRRGHRDDPEFAVLEFCPFCGKRLRQLSSSTPNPGATL